MNDFTPIKNFPYPQKFCPYCEREIRIEKAAHIDEAPEIFKALYFCHNNQCGAFDEQARHCYARVFYSSEIAFQLLEMVRIWMPERTKV